MPGVFRTISTLALLGLVGYCFMETEEVARWVFKSSNYMTHAIVRVGSVAAAALGSLVIWR